ncbi:MAG TPA: cytochrome c3 family protein [Terracidiphilus sp.]|jgi:predicted CXXCH cytochrome family protein|nr:cytochrome c3 family protein [Terracidiphilus sp.]
MKSRAARSWLWLQLGGEIFVSTFIGVENGSECWWTWDLKGLPPTGIGIVVMLALWVAPPARCGAQAAGAKNPDPYTACSQCHKDITERYRKTPMANASGKAADGFIPADFIHAPSGVHYRVYEESGKVWLSYARAANAAAPGPDALNGRSELTYYMGSGLRGRTYLFEREGYWFEAPINWYAKKKVWDMAPAYQNAREMPLTLPVDPGCLHCHTSGAASSLPEARNQYAAAPFAEGGITCAACHGDGAEHVASGGKARMLDIDALPAVRRDSICLNCHLEGQAGVTRLGKRPEDFRPGENLFDYSVFFVHSGENGSGGRATSQWEALLRSRCKIASGDKLTCTTCHDPHGGPSPEKRVEYYRAKCLQCHAEMAKRHHPENRDCTACHMARPPSNDIAHEQVTDHWIRKQVSEAPLPPSTRGRLVSVGGVEASDRDLGLAYAQMAEHGDQEAGERAMELLRKAETAPGVAEDHELHAELGFLYEVSGKTEDAADEYREALAADEFDKLARGNLALIEAGRHDYGDAARQWAKVFEEDPSELGAGFNLAVVECGTGQPQQALKTLDRILAFSPDNTRAEGMEEEIRAK